MSFVFILKMFYMPSCIVSVSKCRDSMYTPRICLSSAFRFVSFYTSYVHVIICRAIKHNYYYYYFGLVLQTESLIFRLAARYVMVSL